MIKSQSQSVVKRSGVENWIELYNWVLIRGTFQRVPARSCTGSALREASIFPQGCLVTVNTPQLTSGELTSKGAATGFEESSYPLDRTAK